MSADQLKKAAQSYLLRYGYSSHSEVGLCAWGKLRADVLALNTKGKIVLCEIKSCLRDYTSDRKWHKYAEYADKAYFVVSYKTYKSFRPEHIAQIKSSGYGLLVLSPKTGYLKAVINAKTFNLAENIRANLIMRLAWRGGTSRRNSRRQRIYL